MQLRETHYLGALSSPLKQAGFVMPLEALKQGAS